MQDSLLDSLCVGELRVDMEVETFVSVSPTVCITVHGGICWQLQCGLDTGLLFVVQSLQR